jgi:hypothetical protein
VRLVGAVLCELNDDRAVVRRCMTIENREEEQGEQKALASRRHAAESINPDGATYAIPTDVTARGRTFAAGGRLAAILRHLLRARGALRGPGPR